jgi:hypothetical protein
VQQHTHVFSVKKISKTLITSTGRAEFINHNGVESCGGVVEKILRMPPDANLVSISRQRMKRIRRNITFKTQNKLG